MTEYVTIPLDTDPSELEQSVYDYIQARFADWTPSPGNLEVVLVEGFSAITAEIRDLATEVTTSIFRQFGPLVGVPPIEATYASTTSTWTAIDTAGYLVPAGTVVALTAADGTPVAFEVLADVTIPNGSSTTTTGAVTLVARDAGADGSALSGPVDLVDRLDFVDTITVVAPTTGGTDAEDDDVYLDRLSRELRLLAPRPIIPSDYELMAQTVTGVGRALGLDGYDPTGGGSSGNPATITVAICAADGTAVSGTIKTNVAALLSERREQGFLVYVIDPTYSVIDVTFSIAALPGWDATAVKAAAIVSVQAFLSPASWGVVDVIGEAPHWVNQATLRGDAIKQAILNTEGVDHISALTFGISGGTIGTANVSLPGAAPLVTPGTIA